MISKSKSSPKSRSKSNRIYGMGLKALRYQYGIFKQEDLANALEWEKHQVRDRECGYASIRLVDVYAFSKVFNITPRNVLKVITEKKEELISVKDFEYFLTTYKMHINDSKDDFKYDMEEGKRTVHELTPFPLNEVTIKETLTRQGRWLMATRIKQGMSSQWVLAMNLGYNPSFVQHRESGETPIKLEELMEISNIWNMNYLDLGEILLSENAVTAQDIQRLRNEYC